MVAAAASLPLAACALVAIRAYARAEDRYRLLAAAFGVVALVAPLALAAAALRPAALPGGRAGSPTPWAELAGPAGVVAAAVAAALLLALALDVARVLRVKRRAVRLGSAAVRGARLGASRAVATPTAIGYFHPAVIVPVDFRARVDAAEWEAVLAHECAHLARGDDWAKVAQSIVLRAGWWLPGLWLLGRALDLERELASDERAAAATGARRYAACLLRLATDRCADVAPALWGRRAHVAIRIERLLRPAGQAGPLARAGALGAFTATAFAVVAAALVAVPGTRAAGGSPRHAAAPGRHVAAQTLGRRVVSAPTVPVAARRPPRVAVTTAAAAPRRRVAVALPAVPPAAGPRVAPLRPVAAAPAVLLPAPRLAAAAAAPHAPRPQAQGGARRTGRAEPTATTARAVAWAPGRRRPCRSCSGPERSADDAFGSAASLVVPRPPESGGGGGAAGGVVTLWIRLAMPTPNP